MSNFFTRLQLILVDRRTVRAIVWFVTIGVLLYLASMLWFGWQDTMTALVSLGVPALLVGLLLSSTSYLWRFGRWEYALHYLGHSVPRLAHLGIYLSGFALTATPGKAGETFRSALLVQNGVKVTHSLATFLVDRGSDVLGMVLLGALSAIVVGQYTAWVWLFSFFFILLASRLFAYFLLHPIANAGWGRLGRCIARAPVEGGRASLEAWAKVWNLRRASVFSVVAMLSYGTQALVFSWYCHILGADISVAGCVLIFVLATLFGAASMIPGGLGAMEAALVFQLLQHGVSDGTAISLAISIRLVTLWFAMLVGVISLLFLSSSQLKPE